MIILIYIFIKYKFATLLDVILRTHLLKYFPPNYLNAIVRLFHRGLKSQLRSCLQH